MKLGKDLLGAGWFKTLSCGSKELREHFQNLSLKIIFPFYGLTITMWSNLEMLKITPIRLGFVSLGLYLHNNYFIRKTYAPQNEKWVNVLLKLPEMDAWLSKFILCLNT